MASSSISARPFSSTRACSTRSSPLPARRSASEVEMVRLDPQYRIMFGSGRQRFTPRRTSRGWSSRSPRSRQGTRRASAGFWRKTAPSCSAWSRAWRTPFLGWQDLVNMRLLQDAADAASASVDRHLSRPFLPRPAHPPRVFLPVEISRHVAVPLPEPVLDPLLSGIRIRRLPSDRRLRRGDGGDGARRAAARRGNPHSTQPVEEILFEGRRAVGVRTRPGEAARRRRGR